MVVILRKSILYTLFEKQSACTTNEIGWKLVNVPRSTGRVALTYDPRNDAGYATGDTMGFNIDTVLYDNTLQAKYCWKTNEVATQQLGSV